MNLPEGWVESDAGKFTLLNEPRYIYSPKALRGISPEAAKKYADLDHTKYTAFWYDKSVFEWKILCTGANFNSCLAAANLLGWGI